MVLELDYLMLSFILTFPRCTTGRSEDILDARLETPTKQLQTLSMINHDSEQNIA